MGATRVLTKSAVSFERSEGTPRVAAVEIRETAPISLIEISVKEANALIPTKKEHYLGPIKFNPHYCLTTPERDALAVFASPTAYKFHEKLPGCLELTRLWQSPARRETRKPLSDFVRATLDWLVGESPGCPCVFSYTDPDQNHEGKVYQWAGFRKLGESRVTDYWQDANGEILSAPYCYRVYRTKSREYLSGTDIFPGNFGSKKSGPKWFPVQGPGLKLIRKSGKILYCKGLALKVSEVREKLGEGSKSRYR